MSLVGGGLASSSAVIIAAAFASVSANSGGTTTNCNPHGNAGCSQWSQGDRLKCTEPDADIGVRVKTSSPEHVAVCLCAGVCGRGRECVRTRYTNAHLLHTARFEQTTRGGSDNLFSECEKNHFCADLDVLFNTISRCTMHHSPSRHSAMLCSSCRGSRGLREPVRTSSERLVERTRTYLALS